MELVRFVNVPNDRITPEGDRILGESWQDTALRVEQVLATPPRAVPVVPVEDRDPDAPPGWYDGPSMDALWGSASV